MLNIGTTTIIISGDEYNFEGTIDQAGDAFGFGKATYVRYGIGTYTGTFKKNKLHGKGKNYRSFILIYYHLL